MRTFALAVALAVAACFGAAGIASAQTTTCTGVMSGAQSSTIPGFSNLNAPSALSGNVTVPAGATCTLSFYNVTGNVQVQTGGNLTLIYDTIGGNVVVGQNASLLVSAYNEPTQITGNVVAVHCASAMLQGNVSVGGYVQIQGCPGSGPNGFAGPGVAITGNFLCLSNASGCQTWLGNVGGNMQVENNSNSDVSLVSVNGTLQCQGNASGITDSHGPNWVYTSSAADQCTGLVTTSTSIGAPTTPAASCAALASLPGSGFPVPNTVILTATATAASGSLPARCIVTGYVNDHISIVDNCEYQDRFQVQLPLAAAWNGRFFMQGGGGTEGSVPTATGTNTGSAGSNFGIINGWAVAAQDGGHENSQLAAASCNDGYGNPKEYDLDPEGLIANADQSIQVTILNAKYLINQYYGSGPTFSYWIGCSTGGRQALAASQQYPQYFDGIIGGDGVYDTESLGAGSGIWALQQIYNLAPPSSYTYVAAPAPQPHEPITYPSFPSGDQALFEGALLQACDALDGVSDGIIDNLPACQATFNPSTATYVSGGVTFPLQCPGAKDSTCLSPAQIQAIMAINQGPRTTSGQTILAPAGAVAPDHADNTMQGFIYDGGYMATSGLPTWKIGRPTSPGSDFPLDGTAFGYTGIYPPNPEFDPMTFNFTTQQNLLNPSSPVITAATSLDISKFINYGHKIIYYHGLSDTLVPVLLSSIYYNEMAAQHGGLTAAQSFSRFYPVPNMGHCSGNPATDQFDLLTPLVNWVENGTAPGPITAKGTGFTSSTYQVSFVQGAPDNAPSTRSRLICPYPQQARFTGSTTNTGLNGAPVAANPSDLASASNYTCITPSPPYYP